MNQDPRLHEYLGLPKKVKQRDLVELYKRIYKVDPPYQNRTWLIRQVRMGLRSERRRRARQGE